MEHERPRRLLIKHTFPCCRTFPKRMHELVNDAIKLMGQLTLKITFEESCSTESGHSHYGNQSFQIEKLEFWLHCLNFRIA